MVPGGPSHFVGPFFSGANVSRHHLPRSIADKYLHFNHYDPSHNLLGTATLPTSTSVASPRGEEGFWTGFGTTTMRTGTSEASSRGEGGFRPLFGTATIPTGTSEPSRRAKEVSKRKKAVISEQREEMASEQRGEEVLPGGDDGFGGKTAR